MMMQTAAARPQWKIALDSANAVRLARAEYKRELKAKTKTSRDLLLDPPDFALEVPIVLLLQWIPGIKRTRALRIMRGIIYQEGMPMRRLSPATRQKLYEQVEHYRPVYLDIP
jgi:hypothetical protein